MANTKSTKGEKAPKDQSGRIKLGIHSYKLRDLKIGRLLHDIEGKPAPRSAYDHGVWSLTEKAGLKKLNRGDVVKKLAKIGILSPATLAEYALKKEDPTLFAKYLGLSNDEVIILWHHSLNDLSEEEKRSLELEISTEHGTGALIEGTPEYKQFFTENNLASINRVRARDLVLSPWFLPTPYLKKAIDYRPYLGPARNQGGRGSCYAFAATAVREFHENIRAGNGEKIDLSEEYIFWYSKKGQRLTAGGGDGIYTLRDYAASGACKETYWPYITKNIPYNHAHVPAPVEAIDSAVFYKGTESVVNIAVRDVEEIKATLKSGRTAVIHTGTNGWNNGSGEIRLPLPGEEFGNGGHAVAVIGFVDSDSIPEEWEGGYFIIRNSWGDPYGINNVMGPEYGGHLRMPYAYYRQFTSGAGTYTSEETAGSGSSKWIAEYFSNKYLEGAPWSRQIIDQISFEWGYEGPITDWIREHLGLPSITLAENEFSARWSSIRYFRGGWYRFNTKSDDGIRVRIDDRLIINDWYNHPEMETTLDFYIPEGIHVIQVEYYENFGHATAKFSYTPKYWTHKIFANEDASGGFLHYYFSEDLAMEWLHVPPVSTGNDQFSVTAEGQLLFSEDEEVCFHIMASGGIRLYLDDNLIVDSWDTLEGDYESAPQNIIKGEHRIKVAFRNRTTVPLPGENRTYKSFFCVNWYNTNWNVKVYHDSDRGTLSDRAMLDRLADHDFHLMQGRGLAGNILGNITVGAVNFPSSDAIKNAFGGGDDFPLHWISLFATKKILSQGQKHRFRIRADDGFRICVDGKCLISNYSIIGSDNYDVGVYLEPGVHDLSLEYFQSKWGSTLQFSDQSNNIWTTRWYDNSDLSGAPVATTQEDRIEFDWGPNGPGVPGLGINGFSIQFATSIYLLRGRYRFVVQSDDGIRLYVNNRMIIDSWYNRSFSTDVEEIDIIGGSTQIRLEYYENTGNAKLNFDFFPVGFLGEYYKGRDLGRNESNRQASPPYMYRYEPSINFDWSSGSPNPRFSKNDYSARWSGLIDLPVGRYKVKTLTDDGVRLMIDGRIIIESWKDSSAKLLERLIDLAGRYHDIVLEYYEHAGVAECRLEFERILDQ